jgi:ATP-dependent helicase/nuclease subunit A
MRKNSILPKFSSFVSASAGTGKTKTLIDRLLNLLLSGIKPSKILCLAFTKAAAAEILTRINQKLAEFAMLPSESLHQELLSLGFTNISKELEYNARILFAQSLDETEPLNIQTIHAFCQQLLLKFPFEAGINLNFSLLTENKASLLIKEAKDLLLNDVNKYKGADSAISYLSWHIKEYSLNELLEEIIANREELDEYFNIHQSLKNTLESIDPNINNEDEIIEEFINHIPLSHLHLDPLYEGGKNDITRAERLTAFLKLEKQSKIMFLSDYLFSFLTQTGDPVKAILSKKISENNPDLAYILEEEQQRVYKFNKFLNHLKAINLTKAFITLSFYIRQIYKELKELNNSLDYDDLIASALKLLNSNEHALWINYKLDGGLEHILVDEAQDTSAKQWEIINKISEDFLSSIEKQKSIFIVGDAKQSIFSFQGAKPELFNAMNKTLANSVLRVQLNQSFRSGNEILQLVDKIFNQTHIKSLVTDIEPIIEHKAYKNSKAYIELLPLVIEEKEETENPWSLPSDFTNKTKQTANQVLAKIIAEKIKEINNPGDILVLTRRRTSFISELIYELRKLNIPTTGLDRFKLLEHPIVLDLISLTNFLLFPLDDLNLAIILKSPIFALSEEQLLDLCYMREVSLWEKLQSKEELKDIVELLLDLKSLAKEKSPSEFYFLALEHKNLKSIYANIYGIEAFEIIDIFLDLVKEYEAENIPSLQLFLDFLNSSTNEVKKDLTQANEQVRIMTVHNAKGLQAKTVILTDTTSTPSNSDSIIWLNQDQLLWPGKIKYYPEIALKAKEAKQDQEYAEYLRLLYVALTRAEDRLIICGSTKNENISDKSWYAIIRDCF